MVHLVTERPREALLPVFWEYCRTCCKQSGYNRVRRGSSADELASGGHTADMTFPILFELTYLAISVTFLIGSVLFLPCFGRTGVDLGCDLYIGGSAIQAILGASDLFGDFLKACGVGEAKANSPKGADSTDGQSPSKSCRRVTISQATVGNLPGQVAVAEEIAAEDFDHSIVEKILYLTASLVFTLGTIYFQHPRQTGHLISKSEEEVLYWAIGLFILGSVNFILAAFLNALSLSTTHLTFTKWAVVTCSVYELGGILFTIGSVCFMPNQGCGELMEVIGAWCFILGSLCYIIGGIVEFMKLVALLFLKRQEEIAAERISRAWRRSSARRRMSQSSESSLPQEAKEGDADARNSESNGSPCPGNGDEEAIALQDAGTEANGAAVVVEMEGSEESAPVPAAAPPLAEAHEVAAAPAAACTPSNGIVSTASTELVTTPVPGQEASTFSLESERAASPCGRPHLASRCECGNYFAEDAMFCHLCGAKRKEVSMHLAKICQCGSTFLEDAIFCQKCGVKRPVEAGEAGGGHTMVGSHCPRRFGRGSRGVQDPGVTACSGSAFASSTTQRKVSRNSRNEEVRSVELVTLRHPLAESPARCRSSASPQRHTRPADPGLMATFVAAMQERHSSVPRHRLSSSSIEDGSFSQRSRAEDGAISCPPERKTDFDEQPLFSRRSTTEELRRTLVPPTVLTPPPARGRALSKQEDDLRAMHTQATAREPVAANVRAKSECSQHSHPGLITTFMEAVTAPTPSRPTAPTPPGYLPLS